MNTKTLVLNQKDTFYRLILVTLFTLLSLLATFSMRVATAHSADSSKAVEIWWPQDGKALSGTQPFKAVLAGETTDQYTMYWQVDSGNLVPMETSMTDHPHKEAVVNVGEWNWRDSGKYEVIFVAKDSAGTMVAQKTITIINQDQPVTQQQSAPTQTLTQPKPVSIWWPSNGVQIEGTQTFKAVLDGASIDDYRMYVTIDGGARQEMMSSTTDHPHKEVEIDVSGLSSSNIEAVFTATDLSGNKLGEQTTRFKTNTLAQTPVVPVPQVITGNPFAGERFYVNPYSNAKRQISDWQHSRPADATQLNKIADRPDAEWFGDWNSNITTDISAYISKVQAQNSALPVIVAYNIPQRDCGSYSAGGANNPVAYKAWVRALAQGIGNNKVVVILEPDALSGMDCLSATDKTMRLALLKDAVEVLKANGNTAVYIDAGHSNWNSAIETAQRLQSAGIAQANGFSLNISNFIATTNNVAFGSAVSALTGGKHFVIDTSRNGNGSNGQWCNPSGRALGTAPTANTGNSLVDAYFWIKKPGDSDGSCNGAPSAGVWMSEYALELARNAS